MSTRRGWTFGRLCVTSCAQAAGAPIVDGASTNVAKWGHGAHGGLVVRRPGARERPSSALVIAWRGWHGPHVFLWRQRWARFRHPIRVRRAPRAAVVMGTTSDVASAMK